MQNKQRKPDELHMGKLLEKLYARDGGTQVEFAEKFDRSDKWLQLLIGKKIISQKNIDLICGKLGIPTSYFEGKYELPLTGVSEPETIYKSRNAELEKTVRELKDENLKLLRKLTDAQEEIIHLRKVNTNQ